MFLNNFFSRESHGAPSSEESINEKSREKDVKDSKDVKEKEEVKPDSKKELRPTKIKKHSHSKSMDMQNIAMAKEEYIKRTKGSRDSEEKSGSREVSPKEKRKKKQEDKDITPTTSSSITNNTLIATKLTTSPKRRSHQPNNHMHSLSDSLGLSRTKNSIDSQKTLSDFTRESKRKYVLLPNLKTLIHLVPWTRCTKGLSVHRPP